MCSSAYVPMAYVAHAEGRLDIEDAMFAQDAELSVSARELVLSNRLPPPRLEYRFGVRAQVSFEIELDDPKKPS